MTENRVFERLDSLLYRAELFSLVEQNIDALRAMDDPRIFALDSGELTLEELKLHLTHVLITADVYNTLAVRNGCSPHMLDRDVVAVEARKILEKISKFRGDIEMVLTKVAEIAQNSGVIPKKVSDETSFKEPSSDP